MVSVEAAFAVAAVVAVVVAAIATLLGLIGYVQCIDAAREAARLSAQSASPAGTASPGTPGPAQSGDAIAAASRLAPAGATIDVRTDGQFMVVTVRSRLRFPPITVTATSQALKEPGELS